MSLCKRDTGQRKPRALVSHFNAFSTFAKYLRQIPSKYTSQAVLRESLQEISSSAPSSIEDLSDPVFWKLFSQIVDLIATFLPSRCLDLLEREFLMAVTLYFGVIGGAR
jgi:hypothetical protein